MIIDDRQKQIMTLVKDRGTISFKELSSIFYASESTIRRDVKKMEAQGLLKEVRGGASIIETNSSETSIIIREQIHIKEKNHIAAIAVKMIENGHSYFFDSSTTSARLIILLKPFSELTAITNGLDNALLLTYYSTANVFIPGGRVLRKTNSTHGVETTNFISRFNCDIAFISCRGLSSNGDITEANSETQVNKAIMLKNATKKVLLIDHSKFNKTFLLTTANIKEIDYIITDEEPPENIKEICEQNNVKILF